MIWGFTKRPKTAFYHVLAEEFGPHIRQLQERVTLCPNEEIARRLRALVREYGGSVSAFAVNGHRLDEPMADNAARIYIRELHATRLSRRGRIAQTERTG